MRGQSLDANPGQQPPGLSTGRFAPNKELADDDGQTAQRADTWENTEFRSIMWGKRNLTWALVQLSVLGFVGFFFS